MRYTFGGGSGDWAFTYDSDGTLEVAAGAQVILFDALTAGNQYGPNDGTIPDDGTGLVDSTGAPISSVTCDANGEIPDAFSGPDGVTKMAADANNGAGPRRWLYANNLGDVVAAVLAQQTVNTAQVALLSQTAPVYVYWNPAIPGYPPRPAVGAAVWWVGPLAPAFGGTAAVDGLDFFLGPQS